MSKRVYLNAQDMYTFTVHVDLGIDLLPEDIDFPTAINMVNIRAASTFATVCDRVRMFDHMGQTLLAKGWALTVEPDGSMDFDVTCSAGDFILTVSPLPLIGSIEITDYHESVMLELIMRDGRLFTEDNDAENLIPLLRKNQ